jgi:ER-bound oxygenase mpaB/B'/Rubber oxygenase, catalytic domain
MRALLFLMQVRAMKSTMNITRSDAIERLSAHLGNQSEPLRAPPGRHGADLDKAMRIARGVRLFLRGEVLPSAQTWAELGDALWQGDPLADDVVAWLHRDGMARAKPMLDAAIAKGLQAVPDAPPELRAYIEAAEQAPAWLDPELMRHGATFLHSTGLHGMMVLRDAGLMAGYQASAINQTLVMTGALQRGVQRRIAETTSWWVDCTGHGGLERFGPGFQVTLKVRVMHALVRQNVRQRPNWDAAYLGLPINQLDMQATYLGFSAVHLLALRATGVPVSSRDAQGVMHLWRYIGWLMGVDERWLFEDEASARLGLYHNLLSQAPPDETSVAMGRALMDEPLQRLYPWGGWIRGPWNKARHLSLVRLFVGADGMRNLGLPATLPWYPVLTAAPRAMWALAHRILPGSMKTLAQRGRQSQLNYLPVMFGQRRPGVAAEVAVH